MIRKSTLSLNLANTGKLQELKKFINEYSILVNTYIDIFWKRKIFNSKFFVPAEIYNIPTTWASSVVKQCASRQALNIMKSQHKNKDKSKPIFKSNTLTLDYRFYSIKNSNNSFDCWIKFWRIGNKENSIVIKIPVNKHKHFNTFDETWTQRKSVQLKLKSDGRIFLDIFFEKQPVYKNQGKTIGIDCGYKKLAVTSEGQYLRTDFPKYCEKINSKKQGSKAFKRALIERNNYINQVVKQIELDEVDSVVVEALKLVKYKSKEKGKISTKFMNKLQRWTYPKFLNRLEQRCEVVGVQYHSVSPSYTSRICEKCNSNHKENRNSEIFRCIKCGYTQDADYNASRNILNRFILQEFTDPV